MGRIDGALADVILTATRDAASPKAAQCGEVL
jgi:hypothetical protein